MRESYRMERGPNSPIMWRLYSLSFLSRNILRICKVRREVRRGEKRRGEEGGGGEERREGGRG